MSTTTKAAHPKVKLVCNECGKTRLVSADGDYNERCPKCGGVDWDVAEQGSGTGEQSPRLQVNQIGAQAPAPRAAHTPGPWTVIHDDLTEAPWSFDVCAETSSADKTLVARVRDFPPSGGVEANARLISAAPELLKAIEELVAVWNQESSNLQRAYEAVQQAEAAIQKARGL